MKLPGADIAIIESAKVREYLLSAEHPVGRFKARFFTGLGYSQNEWPRLRSDIQAIIASEDAIPGVSSDFGQKYEVRGTLLGPSGRSAKAVTVWIVLAGETTPRFVTAFPG
jgi:hypothetical protein